MSTPNTLHKIALTALGALALGVGLAGCSAKSADAPAGPPSNVQGKGGAQVQSTAPSMPPGGDVQFGTKAGK